jgi:esterase/lipase superfamily enzyme
MQEHYNKWYSQWISRDFQMLVFGDRGYPLIIFPTTAGEYYEARNFKLVESIRWYVEQGLVQVFCIDGMNQESWYNKSIHPADKVRTHNAYENVILHDVVEKVRWNTGTGKVAVAGCSFGGYQAANFAFRHPGLVSHMFSLSGAFDIRSFMNGYYDQNTYFNNPIDFLPNLNDGNLWNMDIVLGAGEHDICRADSENLSGILASKNVNHWLDIRPGAVHDWPLWREQMPHYLSRINFN